MGYSDEIDTAIAAHNAWKERLYSAVTRGASVFRLAQVELDQSCDFGHWFYCLPATLRETGEGQTIQQLHAAFHVEAARVLKLALDKQVAEATQALAPGSRYAEISAQLTSALVQWKTALGNE